MKGIILLAICLTFFLLLESKLLAYPKFAALTGSKCADCHVNPTGGVMRHGGGIAYAKNFLTMDMFKKIAGKTEFSPKITEDISIGSDVRVAAVNNQVEGTSNYNSFLAMQGDLYVNVELNKILDVFLTSGIEIPNIATRYEVFGMLHNLPANSFFKVGRFKPNYGIRIVEHRAYQRRNLWNAPYEANTGFELGVSPDWFNMTVGLYNPMNMEFLGRDPHKMVVASTDFTFQLIENDFNVNFGASFFNNPYNASDTSFTTTISANKKAWGGFAMFGIMERVALLGEIDFEENKTDRPLRRSLYGFGELDVFIIKGLELRGQYEIFDINRSVDNDDVQRISAGFAAYPFFGFETELMFRIVIEDPSQSNDEIQWNFHFYF